MVYNGYYLKLSLQNPSQLGPPGPQNKRNGRNEKMKTWKRALALVLALVMALSLVALPSFAEGEETGGGTESTQPVWPAEGSIKLDKDAKAVEGQKNLWEVTLGIQGRNYKTTSDVVLVIDNSNSMYEENGEKMTAWFRPRRRRMPSSTSC